MFKEFLQLFLFLFSISSSAQAEAQPDVRVNDFSNCEEVYSYAQHVLDSSFFFKYDSPLIVEKLTKNKELSNCPAFPMVLTIHGFHNYIQDDLLKSRNALLTADSIYKQEDNFEHRFFIRNNIFLGLNYNVEGDTTQALYYLNTASDLANKINDKKMLADALHNIGLVYLDVDQFEKARTYIDKAVDYCHKSNNQEMLAFSNLTLCRILRHQNQLEQALEKVEEAESIFIELNDLRNLYITEEAKGEIYFAINQPETAIEKLENAIKIGDNVDHKFLHGTIYYFLGELYEIQNKDKSISNFELAYRNSKVLDEDQYDDVVHTLTTHYLKKKDINKFYSMFQSLSSFYAERKEMLKVEMSESNRREISNQNAKAQNEILTLQNKTSKRTSILIFIASIICLSLALYALRQLKLNKKLNKTITDQNDLLGKQNLELKNFAYMASHDLKSPANSIASFAELLRKKMPSTSDDQAFKYLDIIEKSSKGMNSLVTSLLEFSNIENSKADFKALSTFDIIQDVSNNLYSVIEEKQVELKISDKLPKQIIGDEPKLRTLFQNLISNAIKFVPKDRVPIVSIDYDHNPTDHIFSVSDNGIGIEQKYLDKVFLMFQRLNSSSQFEGSGIGLSTCKKIMLQHNGKIDIKSKVGEGSTFSIYLPKNLS